MISFKGYDGSKKGHAKLKENCDRSWRGVDLMHTDCFRRTSVKKNSEKVFISLKLLFCMLVTFACIF